MFDNEVINEIKSKVNYYEFYSNYTEGIKKIGKSYWARCPFHQETKPSFQINVNTGIWKCWGEQIGGDIFNFYSRYYNMSKHDAIIAIAETYGIQLHLTQEEQDLRDRNKKFYNINKVMCRKYQENLYTPDGAQALTYITKRRGFSMDIIKKFKIGCGINNLPNDDRLFELNLIKEGENGDYYSTFRNNRIVIPRISENGKIVSFTGRLINDGDPKYIHTQDTPIFSKHEHVMGLYQAKYAIREHKKVIIVEGELDMIRAHEKGISNTVALSGLALSVEQLSLLKKYTNNFYVYVEDSKTAEALPRLYETIKQEIPYANIYVIQGGDIDNKCDLDDYLRSHTSEDFKKLIKRATTYNEYQISFLANEFNPTDSPEIKTKKLRTIASFLNTIKNSVDREQYVIMVAEKTLMVESVIYNAMNKCKKQEIYYSTPKKLTWLSRPVYTQRIIISTLFTDLNKGKLLDTISKLNIVDYLEPLYKSIFLELRDYILGNTQEGKVDYNKYFTEISSKNDELLEGIITDIHMKSYELEDIEDEQIEELLTEQVDTLKEYAMVTSEV